MKLRSSYLRFALISAALTACAPLSAQTHYNCGPGTTLGIKSATISQAFHSGSGIDIVVDEPSRIFLEMFTTKNVGKKVDLCLNGDKKQIGNQIFTDFSVGPLIIITATDWQRDLLLKEIQAPNAIVLITDAY